jgi:hypothetical protein
MTENLIIEGSAKTPAIKFQGNGSLEMSGKSIPENSIEFYRPLLTWLDEYSTDPVAVTEITIMLEYFNTSSSKCLLDILRKLEALNKSGRSNVKVLWHYEADDEDMMEAGEDYSALINLPFKLAQV